MRIRVFKLFGREVARFESWEQATVSDVVAAMLYRRRMTADEEELEDDEEEETHEVVPCTCCGEMFDPREVEVNRKFDSIVWEAWRGSADDEDNPN